MSAPCMRMRALVLEDEWAARRFLVELLNASGQVEVVAALASAVEAREALAAGMAVDVVFVDIHLASEGDAAGLELVRSCSGSPGAPNFVLATALPQHALAAFELGVVDYLLKPFCEERVAACLSRLAERTRPPLPEPAAQRVVARSRNGLVLLELEEVLAFEASGRLCFVHSDQGRFDVDLSLAVLEASLGEGFLRVHRQWLAHLERVRSIESQRGEVFLCLGGREATHPELHVPVSRERRATGEGAAHRGHDRPAEELGREGGRSPARGPAPDAASPLVPGTHPFVE